MPKRQERTPKARVEGKRLTTTTPSPSDLDDEAAAWWKVFVQLLSEAGKLGSANPVLVRTAAQLAKVVNEAYEAIAEHGVSYTVETGWESSKKVRHYSRPEVDSFAIFNNQLRKAIQQLGLDELGEEAEPLSDLRGSLEDALRAGLNN